MPKATKYHSTELVVLRGRGRAGGDVVGLVHATAREKGTDRYYVVYPDLLHKGGLHADWFAESDIAGRFENPPVQNRTKRYCQWCGHFYGRKSGRRTGKATARQARAIKSHGICGLCARTFREQTAAQVRRRGPAKRANVFTGRPRGNEVYFRSGGRWRLGWIHHSTPTRYRIWWRPRPDARPQEVWRRKGEVEVIARRNGNGTGTTNPGADDPVRRAFRMAQLFNGRMPRHVHNVQWRTPKALVHLGPAAQVDYISDKWDGKKRQYYHLFEGDAQLYAVPDPMPDGKKALLILGDFQIKPEGIVG